MSTSRYTLDVGGIPVEVVRKDIRHLHLGVYPPAGRVRVAAPARLQDEAVRLAVVSRLPWIRRKQRAFQEQDRQSRRTLVSGESHYYQGRRYLLDVVEAPGSPSARLSGPRRIEVRVVPGADRLARERVLLEWYRRRLREALPPLVARWERKVGVSVSEVRIRRMRTRWGSCTAEAGRIWLNLELVKKPPLCLEYILAHEMVHFIERHHTDRFRELMDRVMPTWRLHREELNRAPLAYEDWRY